MKLNDMIESKYLRQEDVDGEAVVTVESLKKVNVARDDEEADYRWTAKYREYPKPMVLNVTNLKRLGKYLGDDTDGWLGQQVLLYVDPDIEFGGKVVGGVRIKGAAVAKRKASPAALDDDALNRKLREAAEDDSVPF